MVTVMSDQQLTLVIKVLSPVKKSGKPLKSY
jgi:hypothetical protein